nr:reverse transcriptase domain-containing protein [Tanacetum cinerariifolium]
PHEVELKDLPPHLEYAFLEGDDKLPVIIAKDLSVEEKTALITLLFEVISRGRLRFLVFLSAYFIVLRGDTQHLSMGILETDTQEKDKNKAKNNKTKHRMEKIKKYKVIRSQQSKVKARGQQKSTPGKSKSNPAKPKLKEQRKYSLRD